MYELPEGKRSTKGKAIVNFLSITTPKKFVGVADAQKSKRGREVPLYDHQAGRCQKS
jgi:hypothetical protein